MSKFGEVLFKLEGEPYERAKALFEEASGFRQTIKALSVGIERREKQGWKLLKELAGAALPEGRAVTYDFDVGEIRDAGPRRDYQFWDHALWAKDKLGDAAKEAP